MPDDRRARLRRSPTGRGPESGQAGAEILFFAFVLLSSMTLVVANAWAVIDTKFMVVAAAREGARSYVESPNEPAAREHATEEILHVIRRSGGRDERLRPVVFDGAFERCGRIVVVVEYEMPRLRVPAFGFTFGTRRVSSAHSEIVDPYRSGLDGEVGGSCAAR